MTKSMNHFGLILATLLVGALAISCNEVGQENQIPEENITHQGPVQMTFKATVAAKGSSTKSVDANGVTTWVVNEQMAVYYQKTNDTYGTATAKVDEVNNGSATISATLTEAKDGGTVKFVYPATLVNAIGDDIDAAKLAMQHGTIADISLNFDAATASATLQTDGTTCGTTENIRFTNQVFIGKFTPKLSGTSIDGITTLTINDESNTYTVTPSSGTFGTDGIYVAMLPVSDKKLSLSAVTTAQTYLFGGKKVTLSAGKLYNNLAVECYPQTVNLANIDADFTARDGQILTGNLTDNLTGNHKISIADGATVTLDGVTITCLGNGDKYAGITCEGDATILLSGTNSLKGGLDDNHGIEGCGEWPGIFVPEGKTLTIDGTGSLDAGSGGDNNTAPGIGAISGFAYYGAASGNIVIKGGTITAIGGQCSAGIGGTYKYGCGDITITGSASVTATGGYDGGAGIGSGFNSSSGVITISTSGTVTATGGSLAAGIGSGGNGTCNNVTINTSGTVTATGGYWAAGIGAGSTEAGNDTNQCGDITIRGSGTVIATGGYEAAGIGSGSKGNGSSRSQCGNILISSCTIIATGGYMAAGIGTGLSYTKCGDISITNDVKSVTATMGKDAKNSIGPGKSSIITTCGTVKFGDVIMYNGSSWTPTDGPTSGSIYGGLRFSKATTTFSNDTWKLTPSN